MRSCPQMCAIGKCIAFVSPILPRCVQSGEVRIDQSLGIAQGRIEVVPNQLDGRNALAHVAQALAFHQERCHGVASLSPFLLQFAEKGRETVLPNARRGDGIAVANDAQQFLVSTEQILDLLSRFVVGHALNYTSFSVLSIGGFKWL